MRLLATVPVLVFGAVLSSSAAPGIQPGQWEASGEVYAVDAPGLPAGMADMMKGQKHNFSYCLTQAQIDNGPQAMFDATEGKCEYDSFTLANGKLNATATCRNPMGNMKMHMTGTYDRTSYRTENRMEIDSPQGTMVMHTRQSGRRTGACTG